MKTALISIFLIGLLIIPCSGFTTEQAVPGTLFGTDELADQIISTFRGKNILTGHRIAVTPLVNLNDFQSSSDLGRLMSEELSTALHFRNLHLAEIRLDDQILMARHVGELILARTGPERATISRQGVIAQLFEKYNLGALVVGTYSVIPSKSSSWFEDSKSESYGQIAFNVKLIDPVTGAVLAVGTHKMELDEGTHEMIENTNTSVLEPVQTIRQTEF
jgi:hypothetical protein